MSLVKLFLIFLNFLYCCPTNAITGGYTSTDNKYSQFFVSLRDSTGHTCGGTLLAERVVVTAAHCLEKTDTIQNVVWGRKRLDPANPKFEIEKIIKHPQFNSVNYKNDIALLYLKKAVNLTKFLPMSNAPAVRGEDCVALGYGRVAMPGPLSNEIIYGDFEIAPVLKCFQSSQFTKGQICYYNTQDNTKSVLDQDDGGPLICNNALAGIISFTSQPSKLLYDIGKVLGLNKEINDFTVMSYATDVFFYGDWIIYETDKLHL